MDVPAGQPGDVGGDVARGCTGSRACTSPPRASGRPAVVRSTSDSGKAASSRRESMMRPRWIQCWYAVDALAVLDPLVAGERQDGEGVVALELLLRVGDELVGVRHLLGRPRRVEARSPVGSGSGRGSGCSWPVPGGLGVAARSARGRESSAPRRARGRRSARPSSAWSSRGVATVPVTGRRPVRRPEPACRRRRGRRRRGRGPCGRGSPWSGASWSHRVVVHRVVVHRVVIDVAGRGVVVLLLGGRPPAVSSVSSSGPSARRHGEAGHHQDHRRRLPPPTAGCCRRSARRRPRRRAASAAPPTRHRPSASATRCTSSTPVTGSRPVVIDVTARRIGAPGTSVATGSTGSGPPGSPADRRRSPPQSRPDGST